MPTPTACRAAPLSRRLRAWAAGAALLAALAACAPPAPPAPVPGPPSQRPERLRPVPPPRAPQTPAPSADSVTMAQYLAGVQDALVARGQLRTDSGTAALTPETLAENFVQIALRDEYTRRGAELVPAPHAAPLRRWVAPVRFAVEFGASVPRDRRAQDRAWIAGFAARLGRATGHPVGLAPAGNFVVLVLSEDERAAIGPRLARLVPGIPADDLAAIQQMSPQTFCTVFAYSRGADPAYANAVAVIRAELPARLRLSCIHEELAQGMGLANDSPAARPSIFNDDEEFAYLTRHDELLLQMLYDPRLRPGMSEAEARPIALTIAAELLD